MSLQLEGLEKVISNINKEISKIEGRCEAGLVSAGLFIRGESQKLTPVVTGNLRNSAYVVSKKGVEAPPKDLSSGGSQASLAECAVSNTPMVIVGYAAWYAIFVHENPNAGAVNLAQKATKYRSEKGSKRIVFSTVGQWKFLEAAIKQNQKRILAIIAAKAKK